MAIPNDSCSECCTCPTATVEWDSRSASASKNGFNDANYCTTPTNKRWLREDWSGSGSRDAPGAFLYDASGFKQVDYTGAIVGIDSRDIFRYNVTLPCTNGSYISNTGPFTTFWGTCEASGTRTKIGEDPSRKIATCSTYAYADLSIEYTTAQLKTNAVSALPAYDDDWNDTEGSFANLSTDELSYNIRQSRYRLRFKIPKTNTGKNYRVRWVERFIPEAGVAVISVEVYSRGVYRPTVTIGAPPSGGVQARAIAVMSSTGTVTGISILNPGSGYSSAPTVTVQAATGGGTSSTGWTATLTAGQVSSIASGSAGDYRPTLAFTGGAGTGATATCTLDSTGGIAAVTVTAGGSAYASEPTLTITPKVTGSAAADLLIHLGTETARCTVWDGATPSGYVAATPSTWPILPSASPFYFELAVPTSDGTTLVANLRAACDGTAC